MDAKTTLERLRQLDELLAGDGAHLETLASDWQTSTKTVRRLLAAIRAAGLNTKIVTTGSPGKPGYHFRHVYVDRRRRLFARRQSSP